MEKRTILAFALCFFVLLIWSYFFSSKQGQRPVEEAAVEKITPQTDQASEESIKKKAPERLGELSGAEDQIEKPQTLIPERKEEEIEIDTPLYRAVFSNRGPSVKSFKLKKYRQEFDPQSPFIELINFDNGLADFLTIDFRTDQAEKNEQNIYQADSEKLRLDPESSPKEMIFRATTQNGLAVIKTFRFYPDQYRIDYHIEASNGSESQVRGHFTTDLRAQPPADKRSYYSYTGLVLLMDNELEQVKLKKISEEKVMQGQIQWMAYEDDYFISAVVPGESSKATFTGTLTSEGLLRGTYQPPPVSIAPFSKVSAQYHLFFGPRELDALKQFGQDLDRAVNFGWTDIIARPLLYALRFFNGFLRNYGLSIIFLTILVKILFWPLTHKSYKSMKEMQKIQPHVLKLREKHKNDRQKMNQEMMALYKTYKVNPMSGCLPMVIQIPVFFALFRILGSAIELRHAPFAFWINDLAAPDRLFNFPFQIPFMEAPYGIPVLTLLMGASMFIQQKMTPTPGDPTQAKIMMFLPIIFTFMFINFPSGLVLYWLVNNVLSIGQQYRIHRRPA